MPTRVGDVAKWQTASSPPSEWIGPDGQKMTCLVLQLAGSVETATVGGGWGTEPAELGQIRAARWCGRGYHGLPSISPRMRFAFL